MNNVIDTTRIDQLFDKFTQPGSPGCALGVINKGDLIFKKGYGLANLEYEIPITPSIIFPVASMSKQFTAFAIALLADSKKLSLDDDVRSYISEVPDFGKPITIRHLIHHTSGLRSDLMLLLAAGWRVEDVITNDDILDLVKRQHDLNFSPGEKFSYCGTGYILLAFIVERVSGLPFAEFCHSRIFKPLGMVKSLFQEDPLQVIKERAYAYYAAKDKFRNAVLTCSLFGGTGLYTTIEDLTLWDKNMYSGQVGGSEVIKLIHQTGVLNDGTHTDYAFGQMLTTHMGAKTVVHGGDGAGIHSFMMRFPDEHFSVVLLGNLNTINAQGLASKVADLYLADRQSDQPSSTVTPITLEFPKEHLDSLAGRYFNADSSTFADIEMKNGMLNVWGFDILPISNFDFVFAASPDDTSATFFPAMDTSPMQVKLDIGMGPTIYSRSEIATPSIEELKAYAGIYYSPELCLSWEIDLEGSQLWITRPRQGSSSLSPMIKDVFSNPWLEPILHMPSKPWVISFDRDLSGKISGFRITDSAGTMRNIKFTKRK
jgi:CubicO group peptidase (beta-lactamase class C family)